VYFVAEIILCTTRKQHTRATNQQLADTSPAPSSQERRFKRQFIQHATGQMKLLARQTTLNESQVHTRTG